jgi:hypothetical protein
MATHMQCVGMPNDPKRVRPTFRNVAFAFSARTSYNHETIYMVLAWVQHKFERGRRFSGDKSEKAHKESRLATRVYIQ